MIKLYTHPNPMFVMNIQNLLGLKGIETQLRNEYALGAVGELSCVDVWPELWVEEGIEIKAREALALINNERMAGEWCCCACKEVNEPAFECCWQCGNDRSDW